MRCSCCGNEVREDERFCNNCGQNNEGYVERKPIERVEIYTQPSNSSTYSQPNGSYQQTNNYYQQNNYQQPQKQESGALGILAIIFSVLGGWLGLLLSIIGLCTYQNPEHKTKCKVGLGIFIGWIVLYVLLAIANS